jgi:hypothetical protein
LFELSSKLPARARMVKKPEAWAWSSYRAHVGLEDSPAWLDTDESK